jgi:hypothetical protein
MGISLCKNDRGRGDEGHRSGFRQHLEGVALAVGNEQGDHGASPVVAFLASAYLSTWQAGDLSASSSHRLTRHALRRQSWLTAMGMAPPMKGAPRVLAGGMLMRAMCSSSAVRRGQLWPFGQWGMGLKAFTNFTPSSWERMTSAALEDISSI